MRRDDRRPPSFACAGTPGDPDVGALITELLTAAPSLPGSGSGTRHGTGAGKAKPFRRPRAGEFTVTYEVRYLADGQRMTVYQAEPGGRDHDTLDPAVHARQRRRATQRRRAAGRPSH
jgi:transcription regulator MmyB-like protein